MNSQRIIGIIMAAVFSLVCSAQGLFAAEPAQGGIDSAELQKFQGSWVMVAAEMDGKKVHDKHVKQSRISYVGNKVELTTPHQHKEKIVATIIKLDVTKTPREMSWVRNAGPNQGKTMIAIYQFEGPDQYKFSFDPAVKETPKKFGTKAGSGHIWHTWKRVQQKSTAK